MTREMFREIPTVPGYEVDPSGVVRSYHRRGIGKIIGDTPRVMALISRKGYRFVHVRIGGKRRKVNVATLVLLAFRGPRPDGMEACHENGVGSDNRLTNLRWDTPTGNTMDAIRHGTRCGDRAAKKLTADRVVEMRSSFAAGASLAMLAIRFSVSKQTVHSIVVGKLWKSVPLIESHDRKQRKTRR